MWVGLALVALHAVIRGWMLSRSWFSMDDLHFMSMALTARTPSWEYLTAEYAGHVMPAGFLVNWVLAHTAGYTWGPWALVLWSMQVVAALGMLRLLVSMFGARWRVLLPLTGYLFWVLTVPAGIWWAAGINQLPLQIGLVFGLHSWLAYLRTRRVRNLLAALAWIAFSLAFYEKSLILFGVFALVAFCWFSSGSLSERVRVLWSRYRLAIVTYGVAAGAYIVWYAVNAWTFGAEVQAVPSGDGSDSTPSGSSSNQLGPTLVNLTGRALAVAAAGGPWRWRTVGISELPNAPDVLMLASWLACGLLIFHAARTRTRSKRAWVLVIAPTLLNLQLLLDARVKFVGTDIALEYRYQTEMAVLMALAFALAFWPLLGADDQNEVLPDAKTGWERPAVAAGAAVVVAVGGIWSTVDFTQRWHQHNVTPGFYNTLTRTLGHASERPVPVIDRGLPSTLMWGYRYPENTFSHVFHGVLDVTYPDHMIDSAQTFDDTGALAYVDIPRTRVGVDREGCGWELGTTTTRIPMDGPAIGNDWWIRLSYTSKTSLPVVLGAGTTKVSVTLPPGYRAVYLRGGGTFDFVSVTSHAPDVQACVTDLVLGLPQPAFPVKKESSSND